MGYTPSPARDKAATKESSGGTKRSAKKESKNGPKKQKSVSGHGKKHCALCAKHGGAERTHDTKNCRKYDADGNLKKSFLSKRNVGNCHSKLKSSQENFEKHSFAAISAGLTKLEKAFKRSTARSRRSKRKRSHRRRDSYSDASDVSYGSRSE